MVNFWKLGSVVLLLGALYAPIWASDDEGDRVKRPKIKRFSDPYARSHILVNRGNHTVLPKGSLIHVPERFKDHVAETHSGSFMVWPTFYKKNINMFYQYEVSFEQALGNQLIDEEKLESLRNMDKIVVAVNQRRPVSMLPPKPTSTQE